MAKERAARRAQREQEAAARATERARAAARADRRRRPIDALRRLLPRPVVRRRGRPAGPLARRRRRENFLVLGVVVLIQIVGWLVFSSVAASLVLLVFTAFALPVAVTLAFDRR